MSWQKTARVPEMGFPTGPRSTTQHGEKIAEREGFEPSIRLPVRQISRVERKSSKIGATVKIQDVSGKQRNVRQARESSREQNRQGAT